MNITYRPIDKWPGEQTRDRQWSRFKARWDDTLVLLERELGYLEAKNVIFQVALREDDFRKYDGQPKTNSRASHPGVILAFDSKYGPLKYATDTFTDFQDNVRAIALGLEALRKVDRYGITKRGEQYTGWKALPASTQPAMSTEAAARFIAFWGRPIGVSEDAAFGRVLRDSDALRIAYRTAAGNLHPDRGGDTEKFQLLQEAKRVLDAHHNGGARG